MDATLMEGTATDSVPREVSLGEELLVAVGLDKSDEQEVTWLQNALIARFMGPTWNPAWANRTQMGPMLAPWTLLFGVFDYQHLDKMCWWNHIFETFLNLIIDISTPNFYADIYVF